MKSTRIIAAAVAAALAIGGGPVIAADDAKRNAASDSRPMERNTTGAGGAMAAKGKDGDSAKGVAAKDVPLIVLMPVVVATPANLGDGCYAQLYDGQNFTGNRLSVVGPVDMPNMRTAFGTDWSGSFDSVAVGPKATVTVYDNENYQQRVAQFKPGERIPDLGDRVGFFEDIRSLRIFCSGRQQASQDAGFGTTSAQQASGVAPGGSTSAGSENRKDRFTRLDTNGDGSISRSEWTASAGS